MENPGKYLPEIYLLVMIFNICLECYELIYNNAK